MLGQFVDFAGENDLDMYFNGGICRGGKICWVGLEQGVNQ